MALMDYEYNEPYRVKEREEAEKSRQKWLSDQMSITLIKKFADGREEPIRFYLTRQDAINIVNFSEELLQVKNENINNIMRSLI